MNAATTFLLGFMVGAIVCALIQKVVQNHGDRGLNQPPFERIVRPTPTPRPPGPFGQQTFPIYPRPGDHDYRTKVEPGAPWPPPPGPVFRWRNVDGAEVAGDPLPLAPVGWLMPSRGQDGGPRPVWGAR